MNMKQISTFVFSLLLTYILSSALSGGVLYLWVMLADWLRNEQGFSTLRATMTMGTIGGIVGLFRAIPAIQKTLNEQESNQ